MFVVIISNFSKTQWWSIKGRGRNNFLKLALRFRLNLFDLKAQNRRNSLTYFEDFVLEDRAKPVLDPDRGMASR